MYPMDIVFRIQKYNFTNMEKYKNIIIGLLVVIIAISGYLLYTKEKVGHSELFALKEECSEKAAKYAEEYTKSSMSFDMRWEVLYSDYIVSRKSCFAEFRKSLFITNTGENTEYLYIYDMLTSQTMASLKLTYEESWEDEAPVAYQKVRKEILGLERN